MSATFTARLQDHVRRFLRVRTRPIPPRLRAVLLGVSLVALALMVVFAIDQRPDVAGGIGWRALLVATLVFGPITFLLKALEYRAAGRLVGRRPGLAETTDVAVMGAAANLLPIPGSALVATHGLSAGGATIARSAAAVGTVGLTWLAVSVLTGGIVLTAAGSLVAGTIVLLLGLAATAASVVTIRSQIEPGRRTGPVAEVVGIEVLFVLVAVVRLALVADALGIDVAAWRMAAFPMAGAIGTAVAFVPAGLGIREGIMGLVSPGIGITVADGLLIGLVDRIIWLVALVLCATAVSVARIIGRLRPPSTAVADPVDRQPPPVSTEAETR